MNSQLDSCCVGLCPHVSLNSRPSEFDAPDVALKQHDVALEQPTERVYTYKPSIPSEFRALIPPMVRP
jgi:hypothetical protein